jgi:hypothetical protein
VISFDSAPKENKSNNKIKLHPTLFWLLPQSDVQLASEYWTCPIFEESKTVWDAK